MFKIEETKYVGAFRDNEFWITRSIMSAFSDDLNRGLVGTISKSNGKNVIKCNFDFPRSFVKAALMSLLPLMLIFSIFPHLFIDGLLGVLYRLGFYGLVIFVLNIVFYGMLLYQYRLALRFVKEIFQCDEYK